MEQFLKNIKLSDEAIKIYLRIFGKAQLTYNELYSISSNLPLEEFNQVINELIDHNLIIKVKIDPKKPELLLNYQAIPPFTSILNYFSYINADLSKIQNYLVELIKKSITQILKKNKTIELDSISKRYQEIKKDHIEDSMIQKQDLEELLEDFEKINEIKTFCSDVKNKISTIFQKILNLTQTQVLVFKESVLKIKTEAYNKIKALDLKKKEDIVIETINNIFNMYLQNNFDYFISTLKKSIESELINAENLFKETITEPINKITTNAQNFGKDFKLLFLNTISRAEPKLNEIQKLLVDKNANLENELNRLEKALIDDISNIIQENLIKISGLNEPIENVLQNLNGQIKSFNEIKTDELWLISSKSRIFEEINLILNNSKKEIVIIVPKVEDFLNIAQLKNLPKRLKIKLMSSDSHTNSIINELKENNNFEFRNFINEDLVALRGDDNYLFINVIKTDSTDNLDNSIGIGTNFKSFINILSPIFDVAWTAAQSETIKPKKISVAPVLTQDKIVKEKKVAKIEIEKALEKPQEKRTEAIESSIPVKTIFTSKVVPKVGDEVGIQINNLFNKLYQRLANISGEDLSKELEKITDFILEKRGFSVTLHKIRQLINEYKENNDILNPDKMNQIFEELESFKAKLL